jgi:PBP1b-binding outer membrane lipoprotein LpoB
MTQDVIKRPWRNNFLNTYQRQPILIVGDILNKSHEHIDAEPFIKDIERELLNAQSVRIVTHGVFREKVRQERQEQNNNASSNTSSSSSLSSSSNNIDDGDSVGSDTNVFSTHNPGFQKRLGRELGADFMLFGTINTIVDTKAEGKHRVIFYQVNLELVDLSTNEVVWIGDKKIKKYVRK